MYARFVDRLLAHLEDGLPLLVVIAGHNGAGKTTIYRRRLEPQLADLIEKHINPDDVEQEITEDIGADTFPKMEFERLAAKESELRRRELLRRGVGFSFETVFSDPEQDKVGFMRQARERGYLVVLLAVGLDSAEKSKVRVALRHARGGHSVDPDKCEGRYPRVLKNFAHGARVATLAMFMDNSTDNLDENGDCYEGVAFFEDGQLVATSEVIPAWWDEVERQLPL